MREGWNTSIASIFSPVPTNLMGFVTTVRMESAAPPRVAVELCEHHSVEVEAVVELLRGVHGVLSCHRVHDEECLIGIDGVLRL